MDNRFRKKVIEFIRQNQNKMVEETGIQFLFDRRRQKTIFRTCNWGGKRKTNNGKTHTLEG